MALWEPGMELREDWLAQVVEPILDPEREIVDPHHHLWNRGGAEYYLEDLWRDTGSGHKVVQTVYIECRSWYKTDNPENMQPVGETEAVAAIAADAARQPEKSQIAGIISFADLRDTDLDKVLDAHIEAGNGLVKGIRQSGARDAEPEKLYIPGRGGAGLYADPDFRRGINRLGERGLTYDTWHYHHQAADYLDLARSSPETTLILNHFGVPLGVGRFEGQRDSIFANWQKDMEALSKLPNVNAKLGGFAMPDNGWGWHLRDTPPGSDELTETYAPWYRHVIDCFGADRCMFESNFPVDRTGIGYSVLWNAFKKIAADYDDTAKDSLFAGTSRRVYGLQSA